MQIRRACEKAYMEAFTQMKIVLDAKYEAEFVERFQTTLEQKAARILESKRRRCAHNENQHPKYEPTPRNQRTAAVSTKDRATLALLSIKLNTIANLVVTLSLGGA